MATLNGGRLGQKNVTNVVVIAKVDFTAKSDECEALTELRAYKQACNNESDSDIQKSIEISNSLREQLLKKKLAKLARA